MMASIQLQNVTVQFPIYSFHSRSLKNSLVGKMTGGEIGRDVSNHVAVTALQSITLELKEGDRLGVMGPNGAGKSTLLRVIAGIYTPTSGSVKVEGRIASLIDISLGMALEASGFENIRMRGVMMGLTLKEIKSLEEEIAEFTELGPYLNMPIRSYSTGMHMRLGFAVSTAVPADILLMDEWLSVGDEAFKVRAEKRLEDYVKKSSILVIASHSEQTVKKLTNQILTL
jgi:lipopolysaccharide transport system ATP-binding protein